MLPNELLLEIIAQIADLGKIIRLQLCSRQFGAVAKLLIQQNSSFLRVDDYDLKIGSQLRKWTCKFNDTATVKYIFGRIQSITHLSLGNCVLLPPPMHNILFDILKEKCSKIKTLAVYDIIDADYENTVRQIIRQSQMHLRHLTLVDNTTIYRYVAPLECAAWGVSKLELDSLTIKIANGGAIDWTCFAKVKTRQLTIYSDHNNSTWLTGTHDISAKFAFAIDRFGAERVELIGFTDFIDEISLLRMQEYGIRLWNVFRLQIETGNGYLNDLSKIDSILQLFPNLADLRLKNQLFHEYRYESLEKCLEQLVEQVYKVHVNFHNSHMGQCYVRIGAIYERHSTDYAGIFCTEFTKALQTTLQRANVVHEIHKTKENEILIRMKNIEMSIVIK